MLRAVLDANVYVSAALNPEGPPGRVIGRFLRGQAFELIVSPAIAAEVLRALAYPKLGRLLRRGGDPLLWFEDIVVLARLVPGEIELAGVCEDPDDDKYLAAAIEGRAAFVVTGDRKLLAVGRHEGVLILPPRAFLAVLEA
ncbi:MAG: putative toxin-antitoxin system toxin component, PIN family [Rhodospirillales bacterium]